MSDEVALSVASLLVVAAVLPDVAPELTDVLLLSEQADEVSIIAAAIIAANTCLNLFILKFLSICFCLIIIQHNHDFVKSVKNKHVHSLLY